MSKQGRVKWYNIRKHFGYITDENGQDHFMHMSNIAEGRSYKGFEDGDVVEFEVTEGKKGPVATNIKLVTKVEDLPKQAIKSAPEVVVAPTDSAE